MPGRPGRPRTAARRIRRVRRDSPFYPAFRRILLIAVRHTIRYFYTAVPFVNGVRRVTYRRNSRPLAASPEFTILHSLGNLLVRISERALDSPVRIRSPIRARYFENNEPSQVNSNLEVPEVSTDEDTSPPINNNNMYQPDQNRNDTQGMHFHVHQCVCTSPLYNPYRQPMIAPYVPPPVPRPYNLAHYQYTSYNIPYNVPIFNPNAIAHPTPPTAPILPETVERRDTTDSVRAVIDDLDDYLASANDANTESFTKFLEQGCIAAEKIAIRNQHRPCFKNIQNLCNRTKNEILKPSHTVSNIHSQGIPWATKDFIYAYVRLINCWHMLKGYLQAKEGTLGNIDRELTTEFKSCYAVWENNTKDLAEHMIKIFSNLDNNVSNPTTATSASFVNRTRAPRVSPSTVLMEQSTDAASTSNTPQIPEDVQFSETTTEPSPREEESDSEGRVYMKPGSYNVPQKNNSPDNVSQSIEFFETAKNISTHYKKLEAKKIHQMEVTSDKEWKNAITASSSLIKKNSSFDEEERGVARSVSVPTNGTMLNDVENIRRWLYNNDSYERQNYDLRMGLQERPVTLLQRTSAQNAKDDILKYGEASGKFGGGNQSERDYATMKLILDELEETEFSKTLLQETSSIPDSANMQYIIRKYNCRFYKSTSAMIEDIRDLVANAQTFFSGNPQINNQAEQFCAQLDAAVERYLPDYDDLRLNLEGFDGNNKS